MSRLIIGLQARGISFLSFHVLAVAGRRSGATHKTVVSPFVVDGHRYVLSLGELQWVRNARVAGRGVLARGRSEEDVALEEVNAPQNRQVVREFPRQIPGGVQFFVRLGLVERPAGPDQFEAAADRLALFRVDPVDPRA